MMMDPSHCQIFILTSLTVLLLPIVSACPYQDKRCTCIGNTLKCSNLDAVPPLADHNEDGNITSLTFESGNLTNIPDNSLPDKLESITFSQLQTITISPDAFNGSLATLRSFTLNQISHCELPGALLQVKGLTTLTLLNTNITNWRDDVLQHVAKTGANVTFNDVGLTQRPEYFDNFTEVTSPVISNNYIINIDINAYKNIPNLVYIYLTIGGLANESNLNEALEPVAHTLETVYLDVKGLGRIPSSFANMPRLTTLGLNHDGITELTGNRIPKQLQKLYLQSNMLLTSLNDDSFPVSSALTTLDLTNCPISTISNGTFEPLKNLTALSLKGTALTEIPVGLARLPNLKMLDMSEILHLSCKFPPSDVLVRWFKSLNLTVTGQCDDLNNTYIKDYLGYDRNSSCSALSTVAFRMFLYFILAIVIRAGIV